MKPVRILTEEEASKPVGTDIQQTNAEMAVEHPYQRLFTAESGLIYPEKLIPDPPGRIPLDTTNMNVELKQAQVDLLPPEQFTLIRRDGFGGSDSGVLLGVSPYDKLSSIINQKATTTISAEELATGEQTAVIKGNDLEPLIIQKFSEFFKMETFKPTDMYRFKEHPYLTMNFDGMTGDAKQYIPVEIKVVTKRGEKHYNPTTTIFTEGIGHLPLPNNYANTNNSWQTKAALYGVPVYYYTQVQQEMFACNAPFGFLCTLWESDWKIRVWFMYADKHCWNALIIEGFKAWEKVKRLREQRGLPEVLYNVQSERHENRGDQAGLRSIQSEGQLE